MLLASLVITGLAGTISDNTISKEERKAAVSELKATRDDITSTVHSLSEAQLMFRPAPDKWNVQECIYHIAISEKELWGMLENGLKEPAAPEGRKEIAVTDEQIKVMMVDRSTKRKTTDPLQPARATWTNSSEALKAFRDLRGEHIRYVRNTTEDLRNHLLTMPMGKIDAYQMILVVNGHSARHLAQIREIMASPGFPSK